jgi:hypothetical protein
VKSWSSTRAGVNEISELGSAFASQRATASTSSTPAFEQDPQRVRQPEHVVLRLEHVEPDDLVALGADAERRAGSEAVPGGGHQLQANG